MRNKHILSILFITLPSISFAQSNIDDIRWIGQIYPPYSYVDSNGVKKGVVVEVLDKILKKSGSKKSAQDIEISAFSKIFIRSNNDKNTVFFPLAKLPKREKMFKWVCPIFEDKPVIYAKKGITITSIDDLKKYKISGKDGYHGVNQLDDKNISVKTKSSDEDAVLDLKAGKVDMVICDEQACLSYLPKNEYQAVYHLSPAQMCFAFNKDTDDALVELVRKNMNK